MPKYYRAQVVSSTFLSPTDDYRTILVSRSAVENNNIHLFLHKCVGKIRFCNANHLGFCSQYRQFFFSTPLCHNIIYWQMFHENRGNMWGALHCQFREKIRNNIIRFTSKSTPICIRMQKYQSKAHCQHEKYTFTTRLPLLLLLLSTSVYKTKHDTV